jgi:hypothetical protein
VGNHNITEDLICLGSNGQCYECGSNSWIYLWNLVLLERENLILNVWSVGLVNIYKKTILVMGVEELLE